MMWSVCLRQLKEKMAEQLRALERSNQEMEEMREAHSNQKLALERENDLLREQLKKYVGMVQAQRKETSSSASDSITSSNSAGKCYQHVHHCSYIVSIVQKW